MTKNSTEFLDGLRNRDSIVLESLVRQHTNHLYRRCFGLGFNTQEAEDITQSVWLTFFEVCADFEDRSSIRTFLFGILHNKASEYRKKIQRADATDNIEELWEQNFDATGHWHTSKSPLRQDRFIESRETMSIIERSLENLPFALKTAFVLKEVEEESTENFCKLLNVTANNVGVLLFRARNQLRLCIEHKSR